MNKLAFFLDPLESSKRKSHGSGAQTLPAFPSSAADHFAAALALHARPEAMVFLPFQVVGLKCSFHEIHSLIICK